MNKKQLLITLITATIISSQPVHAGDKTSRGFYIGGFGGGGTSDNDNISQSGAAYKRDEANAIHGYLADYDYNANLLVNVTGKSESKTASIGGAQIGYELSEFQIGSSSSGWGLRPAIELEGYYLGSSMNTNLSNPNPEAFAAVNSVGPNPNTHSPLAANSHTFNDTINLNMGVLLANTVFNFKTPWSNKILPYVGVGIGGAITSLSGANSTQTSNPQMPTGYEAGINHFNSNNNATGSAFATQLKAGVRAELFDKFSIFAEYRYLNITDSGYTFGSTEYGLEHAKTTSWNVNLGSMNYHTGVFGIQYNL
ncbi:MAG: hypothetical protein WCP66_08030 [Methylococcales bacterium]